MNVRYIHQLSWLCWVSLWSTGAG